MRRRLVEPPALATPASAAAAGARAGAASNASFHASMVIILAAMLCVLACALGLIRCALHCGRRRPTAAGTSRPAPLAAAAAGMERKALRRLPLEVYGGPNKSGVPAAATECAICLGEFADGEKVRVLPRCRHGFHVRCVDAWLAAHTSCPTCRDSVLEDGGAGAGGAATAAVGEGR